MLVVSLLFGVLLGGLIEVLQFFTGRYMEWQDIFTDMLGALLGFLVVQYSRPLMLRPMGNLSNPVIVLLSIIVLLVAFYSVFYIVKDELMMEADFPMIADFESEETLARWDNEFVEQFVIDNQLKTEGKSSALVEFGIGDYPGAALEVIYPDWSAYTFLNISIHNDQSDNLDVEVKVYDRQHQQTGYEYSDRFNHEVSIKPGWSTLQIKLLDILNSPQGRTMDISDIAGFSLFIHDPDEIKRIHLDNIHLSN